MSEARVPVMMDPEQIVLLILEKHKYGGDTGSIKLTSLRARRAAREIVAALTPPKEAKADE